jgi:hypothetical protein
MKEVIGENFFGEGFRHHEVLTFGPILPDFGNDFRRRARSLAGKEKSKNRWIEGAAEEEYSR